MRAFPLTVGPPSADSDKFGSNQACRRATSPPGVKLCQRKRWLGGCRWCSYLQPDCWFSWDPQENVVFHWIFSVQRWDLRTCKKKHYCKKIHIYASELVQQLAILSGGLALVDFDCKQLQCLSGWISLLEYVFIPMCILCVAKLSW